LTGTPLTNVQLRLPRSLILNSPASVRTTQWLREIYYGGGVEPSLRPEWPVRIVVNDGRVTLTGELVDSASREQLETMAWSAGARFVETRLQAPTGSLPMASAQR
jgi:hypothetical protein